MTWQKSPTDFIISGLNRLCQPCSSQGQQTVSALQHSSMGLVTVGPVVLAQAGHSIAKKTECRRTSLQAEAEDMRHQQDMSAGNATA